MGCPRELWGADLKARRGGLPLPASRLDRWNIPERPWWDRKPRTPQSPSLRGGGGRQPALRVPEMPQAKGVIQMSGVPSATFKLCDIRVSITHTHVCSDPTQEPGIKLLSENVSCHNFSTMSRMSRGLNAREKC